MQRVHLRYVVWVGRGKLTFLSFGVSGSRRIRIWYGKLNFLSFGVSGLRI